MTERYIRFVAFLRPILSIWFFVGMPLSMLLGILYTFFGVAQPPLLFLLASVTYFSGSILGGLWSGEHLWKRGNTGIDKLGPLCIMAGSVVFFCLGVVFAVVACKRFL